MRHPLFLLAVPATLWALNACGIVEPNEEKAYPVGTFVLYQVEFSGDPSWVPVSGRQSLPALQLVAGEEFPDWPDSIWVTSGSLTLTSGKKWLKRTVLGIDSAGMTYNREVVSQGRLEVSEREHLLYRYGPDTCLVSFYSGGWNDEEVRFSNVSSWLDKDSHFFYRMR